MFFDRWRKHHDPQISILIPFRDSDEERTVVWRWLERFWHDHLPHAELLIGNDDGFPFSKSVAVNEAARRARGRIFAILDADCFLNPAVIQACADALDEADAQGRRTWFIPYLRLYRLNRRSTDALIRTDPRRPFDFPTPPPPQDIDNHGAEGYGHQFGAIALIMPREAFWTVEGMECRFRGWGGEDSSFMKSLDTLWGLHEVTDNEALHLWHQRPGDNYLTRRWVGQQTTNVNARLGQRYNIASNDPTFMNALIAERSESNE